MTPVPHRLRFVRTTRARAPGEVVRLARSCAVGITGAAMDLVALEALVRGAGMRPSRAKVVSITVSTVVQFVGNRRLVFPAAGGALPRQLVRFALVEALAIALTVLLFRALVRRAALSMELASALAGAAVYLAVSYPLWRRVFRDPAPTVARAW